MSKPSILKLFSIAFSLIIIQSTHVSSNEGWKFGRATRYGGLDDPQWPLHIGSCGYGYIDKNVKTGTKFLFN